MKFVTIPSMNFKIFMVKVCGKIQLYKLFSSIIPKNVLLDTFSTAWNKYHVWQFHSIFTWQVLLGIFIVPLHRKKFCLLLSCHKLYFIYTAIFRSNYFLLMRISFLYISVSYLSVLLQLLMDANSLARRNSVLVLEACLLNVDQLMSVQGSVPSVSQCLRWNVGIVSAVGHDPLPNCSPFTSHLHISFDSV